MPDSAYRGEMSHIFNGASFMIEFNDSQLSILATKAPLIIRIVLALALLALILIPIAVTIVILTWFDGLELGIVFSFILCWGVGFYLLRLILWNSFGRETLILNPDKIIYLADYRLFKDGREEIGTKNLEMEVIYGVKSNKPSGRLMLKSNTTSIETVLQVPISELEELISKIETRYNK